MISGCSDTKCRNAAKLMPKWRSDGGAAATAESPVLTTEDDDVEFEDELDAEFEDELEAEFEEASGFSMMRTVDTCAARASTGSFGSDMLIGFGVFFLQKFRLWLSFI